MARKTIVLWAVTSCSFEWLQNFIRKYILRFVVEDRDIGTLLIAYKTILLNNLGDQKSRFFFVNITYLITLFVPVQLIRKDKHKNI